MVDSIKLIGLSSSFVIGFLLAKTPNFPFFWSFPDLNHRLVVVFWLNRRDSLWLTRACDICWESFPRQPILSFALGNCSGFARIILLESIDYNIYSVWGSHPKLNNHLYLNFLCKMSFFLDYLSRVCINLYIGISKSIKSKYVIRDRSPQGLLAKYQSCWTILMIIFCDCCICVYPRMLLSY